MDPTVQAIAGSVIRHGLTTAAGALVADGLLQSSDAQTFVGGGMLLVGIAWSWWQKFGQVKVAKELARLKTAQAAPAAAVKK